MTSHFALDQIAGCSSWAVGVRRRIAQVASYPYSVLVTGPSGTGKELIARSVHAHSDRSDCAFIPVNCAVVRGELFSSQLFGHVEGAFTGARNAALGCFRAAEGGTIFLDEVGELDLDCQAKLLRVLQERIVVPVGAHEGDPVDIRVVAATNRNLVDEVREGRFRLDLYYRLNVIPIDSIGLRDRVEDVAVLAERFLAKTAFETGTEVKQLTPEALQVLEQYDWPGNVRELQNAIERAVVFTAGEMIGAEAFPDMASDDHDLLGLPATALDCFPAAMESTLTSDTSPFLPAADTEDDSSPGELVDQHWPKLTELEANHIQHTLQEVYYNQSAAARLLGIDRKQLARKIKKYGISVSPKRSAK